MFKTIFSSKLSYFLLFFYVLIVIWWVKIALTGVKEADENYYFGFVYALIALIGGINGLIVARKWGFFKSLVGRGLVFFSLGLLGQWFGQMVWSYYNIVARVEIPYPSIADIGYFSIIPLFALGTYSFAKAAGAKFTLYTIKGKLIIVIIPLVMVALSYFLFLRNLSPDLSDPLRTFLDFGYPLGEAVTISIALVTFELSRGILGGKMRSRILYLIFALFIQYVTDYTFLYRVAAETYFNAGPVDLMYATSFTIMSLSLISFKNYE